MSTNVIHYGLHPDTRVVTGVITQQQYEFEMVTYIKKFVNELIRGRRFSEKQVRLIIEECLNGKYTT